MNFDVVFRTAVPLTILIAAGFFSRRMGIFKQDEERVLSYFVFYLALPAFLFINLAESTFSFNTINFVIVSAAPVLVFTIVVTLLRLVFKVEIKKICLLIVSNNMGNAAFYGIPFIMFAFPGDRAEHLAAISTSVIAIVGLMTTLFYLELNALKRAGFKEILKKIFPNFIKNPIVFAILAGLVFSVTGHKVWEPITLTTKMLGRSAAPIALVMLGAFLYGKPFRQLGKSLLLVQIRILVLPLLALLLSRLYHLPPMEEKVVVLMNAMPLAIAVAVLSQKYNYEKETIATVVLIGSLSAIIYLNIWLMILG